MQFINAYILWSYVIVLEKCFKKVSGKVKVTSNKKRSSSIPIWQNDYDIVSETIVSLKVFKKKGSAPKLIEFYFNDQCSFGVFHLLYLKILKYIT